MALNELYVWIHFHKRMKKTPTPPFRRKHSDYITFDERRSIGLKQSVLFMSARWPNRKSSVNSVGEMTQRPGSGKEKRNKTSDMMSRTTRLEEGIYISKSWVKRNLHDVKNIWRKIRSRYEKKQ